MRKDRSTTDDYTHFFDTLLLNAWHNYRKFQNDLDIVTSMTSEVSKTVHCQGHWENLDAKFYLNQYSELLPTFVSIAQFVYISSITWLRTGTNFFVEIVATKSDWLLFLFVHSTGRSRRLRRLPTHDTQKMLLLGDNHNMKKNASVKSLSSQEWKWGFISSLRGTHTPDVTDFPRFRP